MTLGDVRTQISGLLNRRDLTTPLSTTFVNQGLGRIQRVLRVPSMERLHWIDGTQTNAIQSFEVPDDLLQIIDLYANGVPLQKLAYRQLQMKIACDGGTVVIGQPRYYARVGASLFLYPALPPLTQVSVVYYGDFSPLTDDSSSNEITSELPDLLVYAALSFAGGFFKHDNAGAWEQTFQTLLAEAQDAASQLEMTGGPAVVQSAYGDC